MLEKVSGEEIEFPLLTLKDLESIEDRIRVNQQADAEKMLTDCGIAKGVEKAMALQRLSPNTVTLGAVMLFLETSGGIRKSLELSLAKTDLSSDKKTRVIETLGGDAFNASNLAKSLLGLDERIRFKSNEKTSPLGQAGGSDNSTETATS